MIRLATFLCAALLALHAAAETPSPVPGVPGHAARWLDVDEGLSMARRSRLPVLVWITGETCSTCRDAAFDHADVAGMLPDFITVRAPSRMADQFGLEGPGPAVVLLDPSGEPVPGLAAAPDDPAQLIDLMSSGLDILR